MHDEMDERIQRALDGDLPRSALTPAEAAALDAAQARIDAVLRAVPRQAIPDLAPAVLRRIDELAAPAHAAPAHAAASQASGRSWLGRLRRQGTSAMAWRPAYGLAAAALFVIAFALGRETAPTAAMGDQPVLTQFVLVAPEASDVALAGDFTEWQPSHVMTRSEAGVWTVVVPLDPGIHNYAFVVNGEQWTPDPNAPAIDDGFGGLNSRLAVLAPDDLER